MVFPRTFFVIAFFAAIVIAAFISWQQHSPKMNGSLLTKREEMADQSRETKDSISPACTFNHQRGIGLVGSKIEKIVLLHMRKAGGTSIWAYLCRVADEYNVDLISTEARLPLLPEEADSKTLLVTHIRAPTARLVSHYKYEERWLCRDLTNRSFRPTLNNTRISLRDFVESPNKATDGVLWECAHNCYSKWSTGLCWDEGAFNESTACWSRDNVEGSFLYRAREVMFSYNLVIVIEWLQNPEYVRSLETLFGVEGIATPRQADWCSKESAAANKKWPLIVPKETKQRILQLNQLDTRLYNELTSCSGFDFPNRSIFM